MKIAEIIAAIEAVAPASFQEDYDNSGLIVGNSEDQTDRALLTLDCTEEVVREAAALGCNLIIAHHPIVFRGLKRFNGSDYVQRTVMEAIRRNIAIYACHTNLDNVLKNGVNARIAERLGLTDVRILKPAVHKLAKLVVYVPASHADVVREAMFAAGAGGVGNYDECSFNVMGEGTFRGQEGTSPFSGTPGIRQADPEWMVECMVPVHLSGAVMAAVRRVHPYEEVAYQIVPVLNPWQDVGSGMLGNLPEPVAGTDFPALVKQALNAEVVRYTAPVPVVKTVALCGGAGSFLIRDALRAGADAYVTADVKYHEFFDAEGRMMICDPGHFETERFTPDQFAAILSEKFPNFATIFSRTVTNPVLYHY